MIRIHELNQEVKIHSEKNRQSAIDFIEMNKCDDSCLYYSDYTETSFKNILRMLGFVLMVSPRNHENFLLKELHCYEKNFPKLEELYESFE